MDTMQFPVTNSTLSIGSKPVILAADDHEDNLLLLSLAVEQLFNCLLLAAVDGQTVLTLAKTFQPDLILLDILLPDLNGLEVVRRLKQQPETSRIPIVAVTALAKIEDREKILAAGCDDYLCKPYMLEDLEAAIRQNLRIPSLI